MSTFMNPTYENLDETGFKIIPSVLDIETCERLRTSLIRSTCDLIFTRQGYEVDFNDPKTLQLFTDVKAREKKFGEEGRKVVWRDGNSRKPLLSKNCGIADIHFDANLLEDITFNPLLYNEMVKMTGVKELVHSDGPERFCIKAKGATDMPKHIDSNLFYDEVNTDFRIQSLVTLQIDTAISPRDSGTLCLLTYFHHYWRFAGELFHPETGLEGCRFPDIKSRFFVLPMAKGGNFDVDYLPALKKHASLYEKYLLGERGTPHDEFYLVLEDKGVNVPPSSVGYLEKMNWTPIPTKPGDMIFWHQNLPHQNLRQRSNIPRICAYYSVYPVDREWFGSDHQRWIASQFERCQFTYSPSCRISNVEEYEMISSIEGEVDRISGLSQKDRFRRCISAQEDWFEDIPTNLLFVTKHWTYAPDLVRDADNIFQSLLSQIEVSGETSCTFGGAVGWSEGPKEIILIKRILEEVFECRIDHVLCHIYRRETGWNDEVSDSEIFSVFLGASQKFQFRSLKSKKIIDQITLKSGDVVHMHRSCRRVYAHRVKHDPCVSINLTFK